MGPSRCLSLFYLQLHTTHNEAANKEISYRSERISRPAGVGTVNNKRSKVLYKLSYIWACPIETDALSSQSNIYSTGRRKTKSHKASETFSSIVRKERKCKERKIFSFIQSDVKRMTESNESHFFFNNSNLQKWPLKHTISAFEWGVVAPYNTDIFIYRPVK